VRHTHTRLRGVDPALDQVSYAPTISCVILARITLYKSDRVLDRPTCAPHSAGAYLYHTIIILYDII
jgi:hypothetical protein